MSDALEYRYSQHHKHKPGYELGREEAYVGESRITHTPASRVGWPVQTLCGLTATGLSLNHNSYLPLCNNCLRVLKGQSDA